MRILRKLIFPLLLLFPYGAAGAAGLQPSRPSILVLGDSLSAGYGMDNGTDWVSLLRQRLQERGYRHRVVNTSVSGATSLDGRTSFPALLQRHSPQLVILELGGNDGLRGLPLDALEENLEAIVTATRGANAEALLVGMRIPPNLGPAYTKGFEAIYPRLSTRLDVELVPFLLEGVAGSADRMQEDGLHAGEDAQPRLLENVWPHLEPLLGR